MDVKEEGGGGRGSDLNVQWTLGPVDVKWGTFKYVDGPLVLSPNNT